jgi:hypothetical protein
VRLKIDVNQRLVVSTYFGEVNEAEVLGHASRFHSHPDFDPSFAELVDFSGVTSGSVSLSTIQAVARRESILNPTSMHVIIAPRDAIFGLARMSQVYAEETKPNFVVVRTIDEAHKLLRLEKTGLD